jgi:hypothetical protein
MEKKQYNAKKMVAVLDFIIATDKILKEYDMEFRDAMLYQIETNEGGVKHLAEVGSVELLKTLIDLRALNTLIET